MEKKCLAFNEVFKLFSHKTTKLDSYEYMRKSIELEDEEYTLTRLKLEEVLFIFKPFN